MNIVLDGMAMVKLNVFHWHITDSHSFPLVIEAHPDLVKYGAFSDRHIYTADMVKDVSNPKVLDAPEF